MHFNCRLSRYRVHYNSVFVYIKSAPFTFFVSFFPIIRGKGEPVTELSWPSCRQLLYQSVATVLAHAGFESAQESVLETLTDLVHEHYLRITRLLRVAVDREARLGASPFPDVMEQVFHEVGIGSVLDLQRFWQVRIKDYHSYMLQVGLHGSACWKMIRFCIIFYLVNSFWKFKRHEQI